MDSVRREGMASGVAAAGTAGRCSARGGDPALSDPPPPPHRPSAPPWPTARRQWRAAARPGRWRPATVCPCWPRPGSRRAAERAVGMVAAGAAGRRRRAVGDLYPPRPPRGGPDGDRRPPRRRRLGARRRRGGADGAGWARPGRGAALRGAGRCGRAGRVGGVRWGGRRLWRRRGGVAERWGAIPPCRRPQPCCRAPPRSGRRRAGLRRPVAGGAASWRGADYGGRGDYRPAAVSAVAAAAAERGRAGSCDPPPLALL